jgi:hypothetical protein
MTRRTEVIRLDAIADSLALANTFSAIGNLKTGIGTGRAKTEGVRVKTRMALLSRAELEILPYQDEIIRNAVHLYPEAAVSGWFKVSIADSKEGDNLPALVLKYLEDVGDREDATEEEELAEIYGAKEAFLIASISARQFGKGYILMGIDDGRDFAEPIDWGNVRSLRYLQVYDRWDLMPVQEKQLRRSPSHYYLYAEDTDNYGQKIHHSRLLPFYGNRVYSRRKYLQQGWADDGISVIQSMYDAYADWLQGIKAGSAMLADYDVFTLGMKGLGQLMLSDRRANSTAGQEAVAARALSLDEGKSVVRGILYDLENEEPGSITRQYGGARDIVETLESRFVAATNVPEFKLFGRTGTQGLANSNSAGLAMRSEWAILTQSWANSHLAGNMAKLLKVAFAAKDSPSKGKIPESYEVFAPFDLPLTDTERMEYEKLAAERSQILVNIKAIAPKEIRSGYRGNTFNSDIMLESDDLPDDAFKDFNPPVPAPESQPPATTKGKDEKGEDRPVRTDATETDILSNEEWRSLAEISAAQFVEVAEDVGKV